MNASFPVCVDMDGGYRALPQSKLASTMLAVAIGMQKEIDHAEFGLWLIIWPPLYGENARCISHRLTSANASKA